MRTGIIYRIVNKINGKSYIGQTVRPLDVRMDRHFKDAKYNYDDYCIHQAIRKYGAENFIAEILQDNIPISELNDREIYWIAFYHTYIKDENCNGYNMTPGGDSLKEVLRKLSDEDVKEVKHLLKTTKLTGFEIAEKFNVSFFLISDINIGKCWYDKNEIYPIRPLVGHQTTQEDFLTIIKMLKTNLFSYTDIEQKLNVNNSTISKINTGIYAKYEYPNGITFPISKIKTVSNGKMSTEDTLLLLNDYLSGNYTRGQLAIKYNISTAYVKAIVALKGKCFLEDLKKPLKENLKFNQELIKEKLELIEKFK